MKEIVLITGSNGGIAQYLETLLSNEYEIRFLTRKKTRENEFEWNIYEQKIDINALIGVNHIIHLAGAGIADKKWTSKRKYEIISSRVNSSQLLLKTLKENNIKINTFISASAIGYYGSKTSEKIYTETNHRGKGFLSNVCFEWENAADNFAINKISNRVIITRIGIVLSNNKNGALEKMKKPILLGLGANLGSGKQYMPWIHIEDLCNIFLHCLKNNEIKGIYNAVSPHHVTNKEFTHCLAKVLKRSIIFPNIPKFLIKLIFGESSIMLLEGSRVSSYKIEHTNFNFKFRDLKSALEDIFKT